MKSHAVVLYSGGPDSFISYKWTTMEQRFKKVESLYVGVGHRYLNEEVSAVLATVPDTEIEMCLSMMGPWEQSDSFIWGRNAFLCLVAAKRLREGGTIVLSVQKDEVDLHDRSVEFQDSMSELCSTLVGHKVEIFTPWIEYDKTDMVTWFLQNFSRSDTDQLLKTHSCYRPYYHKDGLRANSKKALACGDCAACFRRAVAFELNGIEEAYAVDPLTSKTAKLYLSRALNKQYSPDRNKRITDAISLRKK